MAKFKVGDCASWNSEGGTAKGRVVKIHTKEFTAKGYKRHASAENPIYELKLLSGKGVAYHFGGAMRKINCK